jgi:uncharacterized membrane protein YkoI
MMNRAPVHIAMLLAANFGFAAGAQAFAPGVSAYGAQKYAVAQPVPIYVQSYNSYQNGTTKSGNGNQMIPPSEALQAALGYAPGSQGLGVRLLPGARLVYAVKLKSGNRIRRVLIDARTGRVLGE